jgi:hypothetical protein
MKLHPATLSLSLLALLIPAQARSHFILEEPTATLVLDPRGNPQKPEPCGAAADGSSPTTSVITPVKGGTQLHIKVKETVYHPGHYRVALAGKAADLPPDPETVTRTTEKGPYSVSAKIDKDPKPPVLADGLFVHTERVDSGHVWETDVRIPNIDCDNCTLQVIQWMAEHGFNKEGGYTYHHCAELKITADPKLPVDKAWVGK